jgi:hypothetical protein
MDYTLSVQLVKKTKRIRNENSFYPLLVSVLLSLIITSVSVCLI